MMNMDVEIIEDETKGAAIAKSDGQIAGKMTYTKSAAGFIIIDHTEVDPAFKGQGVGKQLLLKIVEMAREKHIKILPLCPFASTMFEKMKEIQDVLR
jgi:uncharacterized protein